MIEIVFNPSFDRSRLDVGGVPCLLYANQILSKMAAKDLAFDSEPPLNANKRPSASLRLRKMKIKVGTIITYNAIKCLFLILRPKISLSLAARRIPILSKQRRRQQETING